MSNKRKVDIGNANNPSPKKNKTTNVSTSGTTGKATGKTSTSGTTRKTTGKATTSGTSGKASGKTKTLTEKNLPKLVPEMSQFLYDNVDKALEMNDYAVEFNEPVNQAHLSPDTIRKLQAHKVIAESLPLPDRPEVYLKSYVDSMKHVMEPRKFNKIPQKANVKTQAKDPEILSITAISLCHGKINADVEISIKDSDDRKDVKKNNAPTISEISNNYSVNYDDKFKFNYKTIPYCGVFSNVGSCPGLPTAKAPGSFMTKQNIVNYESKVMMCDGSSGLVVPEVCNPYMLYSTLSPSELTSFLSERTSSEDIKINKLLLTMHSDFLCQTLVDKTYTTVANEVTTRTGEITKGDAGKFILLTKYKDEKGIIGIVKTVILGASDWESQLNI